VIVFVGRRYLRPISIFPDVPAEHPNNLAITYLYKKSVMMGSEDPESGRIMFRPDETINRVEILKTVFENKRQQIPSQDELLAQDEEIFVDVKADHWFAPYVYLAKKMNIVKGNDGLYRPADAVTLVEALKIIIQANQISLDAYISTSDRPYPDAEADEWYVPSLFFVKQYNLFDVDEEGHINPSQPLTRAKMAEILYRMDSVNLFEKRGYLTGFLRDSESSLPITEADVLIYQAVEQSSAQMDSRSFYEKGDLYYSTRVQNDGSFSVSLPIDSKYFIEAVRGANVSVNQVITEVKEEQTTRVELEMRRDDG